MIIGITELWNNGITNFILSLINLIELFPSLTWWQATGEEGVGEGVVGELLCAWVEEELGVQTLCDNSEAEDLGENAVDLER